MDIECDYCSYITGVIGHHGRGVMIPRGGIPIMGVGRGDYPFAGPTVDYYFNPYVEESMEIYGGGRPSFHRGIGSIGTFYTLVEPDASMIVCKY